MTCDMLALPHMVGSAGLDELAISHQQTCACKVSLREQLIYVYTNQKLSLAMIKHRPWVELMAEQDGESIATL
jgi:hypothetical protein